MRIVCPKCAAAYEVPADRLKVRRTVRCARCDEQWAAVKDIEHTPAPADAPPAHTAAQAAALPAFTAMDRLVADYRQPKRSIALMAAWVLTLGVLIAAAAAAIVWRADIVHAWPPSARILGIQNQHLADTPADTPEGGRK